MKTKHTKGKWICIDIAFSGELLIQNEAGKAIAEVYNEEDVPLIKSAPKLLEVLKSVLTMANTDKYINFHANSQLANEIKQAIKATE